MQEEVTGFKLYGDCVYDRFPRYLVNHG